jgi:hypothetical protein
VFGAAVIDRLVFLHQHTGEPPESDGVSATIANQGYVSVNGNSVMYPSIGVAAGGTTAAMVFTLAGPDFYPSSAYIRLTSAGALSGPVLVYGAGIKPADGFTGYPQYGGNGQERWGDYSAAVADATGVVWIPAVPRELGDRDRIRGMRTQA